MIFRSHLILGFVAAITFGCASQTPPPGLDTVNTEGKQQPSDGQQQTRLDSVVVAAITTVATKTFTWEPIKVGDCHQIEGTLELRADGTATFKCVTWTDSTSSGDYWWSGLLLQDHSGVTLHNEKYHKGPRMDDGHPSPRYRWSYDFNFDQSKFNEISKVVQSSKC